MAKQLTALEEFDIIRDIQLPYTFEQSELKQKGEISRKIFLLKYDDILLISSHGFSDPVVLGGLSEKNMEYIAIKAPLEYRTELLKIINNEGMTEESMKIAKFMDMEMDEDIAKNQYRVRNVIQYIRDNQIAFEF